MKPFASTANPAYTSSELEYQLSMARAKIMIVHPMSYSVALAAARAVGLSLGQIILFDVPHDATSRHHCTLQELIIDGLSNPQSFIERSLQPGEGKTKLAFLSFSSGTTGKGKVSIPMWYACKFT